MVSALSILVAEELFLQEVLTQGRTTVLHTLSILVAEELFLQGMCMKMLLLLLILLSILVAEELFLQVAHTLRLRRTLSPFNPRC